jgi:hypothetical protein
MLARASGLLDIYTFGMHADVVENSRGSNGTFSGYHTLVGGSNDNIPFPPAVVTWNGNRKDAFMPGAGNSVVTRYNSGWSGNWVGFGSPPSGTLTVSALATAANWWQPGEYDVAWQNPDGSFSAIHVSNNGATFGPITSIGLGWSFVSPPSVIYGADGLPYYFGIGMDGCLYFTTVDWWDGLAPDGPYSTNVCGLL